MSKAKWKRPSDAKVKRLIRATNNLLLSCELNLDDTEPYTVEAIKEAMNALWAINKQDVKYIP